MSTIQTSFNWSVYADATFAGISILIPIPGLDITFEWFFRRRMPETIAQHNRLNLDKETLKLLNETQGCMPSSCLAMPLFFLIFFLKRLSKKILYFLTIKESADTLSYYWHRAFLLNHAMLNGYVKDTASSRLVWLAMEQVLSEIDTTPLSQLAGQVVAGTKHVWRSLRHIRFRKHEDSMIQNSKSLMQKQWDSFADYLMSVAQQFDATLQKAQPEAFPLPQETNV